MWPKKVRFRKRLVHCIRVPYFFLILDECVPLAVAPHAKVNVTPRSEVKKIDPPPLLPVMSWHRNQAVPTFLHARVYRVTSSCPSLVA